MSLGTRASEEASIDGVWAYGRNFSVSELGRGHVTRNVGLHKQILSQNQLGYRFPTSFIFFARMEGGD